MVFFLFQKSTFVINENNITQNWNMDFFFFRFFIIYQLKIWWCFWRDRFGKRDVLSWSFEKNAIFQGQSLNKKSSSCCFEGKVKFVMFLIRRFVFFLSKLFPFITTFSREIKGLYLKTRDGLESRHDLVLCNVIWHNESTWWLDKLSFFVICDMMTLEKFISAEENFFRDNKLYVSSIVTWRCSVK